MKRLSKLLFVFALVFWGVNTAKAQRSLQQDKEMKMTRVKGIVRSKNYVFEDEAKTSSPRYDLVISNNTLTANLPARGNWANPMHKNMRFTCDNFNYNSVKDHRGDWRISIKPTNMDMNGMRKVKQVNLYITPLGYASLHVRTNHGVITYHGYIKQKGYDII